MSTLTKVFIVLQLICSIGLAVVVVMAVGADKDAKTTLNNERSKSLALQATISQKEEQIAQAEGKYQRAQSDAKTLAEKDHVTIDGERTEIIGLKTKIDQTDGSVAEANANLTRTTAALTALQQQFAEREKEVEAMRPEFAKLREQNAQLTVANQQLQNQYDLAGKTIRQLQEALAAGTETPKAGGATAPVTTGETSVAQLSAVGAPAATINGHIGRVQPVNGKVFVTLTLGARDGVKQGDKFRVCRDPETYVADVEVQQVGPDTSVGLVKVTAAGQTVKPNDLVTTDDSQQ